ncbi:MAG: PAS domain S-box protein [Nitrospirota bacterium]|nr:MAG: PAS domain S-box protein [Nitrospirota bacterium]
MRGNFKLAKINVWKLLVISIIVAETFTFLISYIASLILWGGISREVLIIGAIDSFAVCAIVVIALIYLIKRSVRLEEYNEQLREGLEEIRRAHEELRVSEDKFRTIVENSQPIIFIIDRDGIFTLSEGKMLSSLGLNPGDVVGLSALDIYKDYPDVLVGIKHASEGSVIKDIFLVQDRYFDTFMSPHKDSQGNIIGVIGMAIDITEKKQLEEEIIRAKMDWEESFDIINDAITIHDTDFNIIRANEAAIKMLGVSLESIRGQKCYMSYHGTECPPKRCPSCDSLKTGKSSVVEAYEPHLNKFVEIKALPRFDDDNNVIGLVHVVRDIDARKRAEESLMRANLLTHEIIERSPFGIYVINGEGIVEFANSSMAEISRIAKDEFMGMSIYDMPLYKENGLTNLIISATEGRSFHHGPVDFSSNGNTSARNYTGIPFGDNKALVFVEDISELTKIDLERRRLQSQLLQTQKMESIGRLTGGIAHDFNNILSSVIGFSELTLRKLSEGKDVREYVEVIIESGDKAAELTKQLLAFSRQQVLDFRPTDINSVVENMGKILSRTISEDIDLKINLSVPVHTINADRVQIEQIIMNLVVNARDALTGGGKITIETSNVTLGKDFICAYEGVYPGPYVMLTVTDNGVGIPEGVLEKIFEPFFTTKEIGKGTGLGLATVYGIVKQHMGCVTVDSNPGDGTCITVFLPAVSDQEEDDEIKSPQLDDMPSGSETILLAEDDDLTQKVMIEILEPLGYKVLATSDGREALQLAADTSRQIDLLLTDVIMPKMNGIELSKELRKMNPRLKVIFITGYADGYIRERSEVLDNAQIIFKPMKPSSLAQKVRNMLDDL